jgi:Ankyrin repeats (3 copies)
MADRALPARPDLDQYRKQAKDLLKRARAGDDEAWHRITAHHPRYAAERRRDPPALALADVQLVIAREHGIASWPKFVQEVEWRLGDDAPRAIWRAAERALESGDVETLERLLREHEDTLRKGPARTSWLGGLRPDFSAADVRSIVASNHEFDNWDQFAAFAQEWKRPGSPVWQFEAAVDAIVAGDVTTLSRLLRERPALIRMRSMRRHHSTLLHYVGANGVEGFRQRTPKNAVDVATLLLDAGADVDANADMYGGATTVGLVATSCHPRDAGVQNPLIDLLVARGASIGRVGAGGGNTYPLINSALANGRPGAAEHLALRGAPIDLEGAAGIGRLDLVRSFFDEGGALTNGATPTQMRDGFSWACEYGRTDVVRFLIERGMDVSARLRPHQQTGLHWAAHGGHLDTVEVLLAHGAPLDVRDQSFDGIPLEWAMHGWHEQRDSTDSDAYYDVVALLVAAGTIIDPTWVATDDQGRPTAVWLDGDVRMHAALLGRRG